MLCFILFCFELKQNDFWLANCDAVIARIDPISILESIEKKKLIIDAPIADLFRLGSGLEIDAHDRSRMSKFGEIIIHYYRIAFDLCAVDGQHIVCVAKEPQ